MGQLSANFARIEHFVIQAPNQGLVDIKPLENPPVMVMSEGYTGDITAVKL